MSINRARIAAARARRQQTLANFRSKLQQLQHQQQAARIRREQALRRLEAELRRRRGC